MSLLRVLNLQEQIGTNTVRKIELNSGKEKKGIFNYLVNNFINNSGKKDFTAIQTEKLSETTHKFEHWKKKINAKLSLLDFFSGVLGDFNYSQHLKVKINYHERMRNIQQFLNIVQSLREQEEERNFKLCRVSPWFLSMSCFCFWGSKIVKTRNNLILSSVHQAKGLEFEVVFFAYLDQGTLPYRDAQDLAEEKRLFYVGITRPKKLLYLTSSKKSHSPFLEEIDKEFLERNKYFFN